MSGDPTLQHQETDPESGLPRRYITWASGACLSTGLGMFIFETATTHNWTGYLAAGFLVLIGVGLRHLAADLFRRP